MTLESKTIFESLLEWPHRGAGTEEEMMAREMLLTHLEGEYGVNTGEEAFYAPRTYLPFFGMIAAGQLFAIWSAEALLYIALLVGTVFWVSHSLFFDWRQSLLVWFSPKKITANLVAKKGEGRRLFILMAHLDSAPASFAYRPEHVKNFSLSVYLSTVIVGTGVIIPLFAINGYYAPVWLLTVLSAVLIGQFFVSGIDFWRFGYTPGANDNLSGVAAAVAAASRLWRHMPADCEVRLVVPSAEEAGMLGAQHYFEQHEDELLSREVYLVNWDTVGAKNIKFITQTGGFTPVYYDNLLTNTAQQLTQQNVKFKDISSGLHRVGDFDTIWFQRAGVSALTLASYDDEGAMPHIHTEQDKAAFVDLENVELASRFGEALIRMIP